MGRFLQVCRLQIDALTASIKELRSDNERLRAEAERVEAAAVANTTETPTPATPAVAGSRNLAAGLDGVTGAAVASTTNEIGSTTSDQAGRSPAAVGPVEASGGTVSSATVSSDVVIGEGGVERVGTRGTGVISSNGLDTRVALLTVSDVERLSLDQLSAKAIPGDLDLTSIQLPAVRPRRW